MKNASSYFYYDWTHEVSLIDYPEQCIAIVGNSTSHPCKIYFNPKGSFLSQPSTGVKCCAIALGVGSVPPQFLAGFDYNGTSTASDLYGSKHQCNLWTGSGFAYWTDITSDLDIYFRDGPVGPTGN